MKHVHWKIATSKLDYENIVKFEKYLKLDSQPLQWNENTIGKFIGPINKYIV